MIDAHHHRFSSTSLDNTTRPSTQLQFSLNNSCTYKDWSIPSSALGNKNHFHAIGIHPWFIGEARPKNWLGQMEELLAPNSFCIGEIGLDTKTRSSSLSEQLPIFIAQWQLALEHDICPSIHCVGAWNELVKVIKSNGVPSKGFFIHGFSGSQELGKQLLQLGAFFGIQNKDWKKWESILLKEIPRGRILPETDFHPISNKNANPDEELLALHQKLAIYWNQSYLETVDFLKKQALEIFKN